MGAYLMGTIYVVAGLLHFIKPKFYLQIMPPYVPAHNLMVVLSGIAEVLLGLGLFFPATRTWAAWGIILLLVAIFPANLFMAYAPKFQDISPFIRWGRLPLQFVLIWWAYQYTR
ncbi:DoxX family protein [Telluribacter sp.]|jgi:uncharacterized membrane protein|uniref:DoxX family protein n=1 Tax=Telluribacter sp. TaxID=1978767 RepID=UPI002E135037|nr:DoxX family protein [Telluribacter sp.]